MLNIKLIQELIKFHYYVKIIILNFHNIKFHQEFQLLNY